MQSVEGLTSLLRIVEERLFVMKVEIKRMSDRGFLVDVQITMLTLWKSYSYQSAEVEMYIVCTVLVNLGYFLDIFKCALAPVTRIQHVGMIVEFIAQAFRIPEDKIKIAPLQEQILWRQSTASLRSFQRLMEEMYFLLAGLSGGKILHFYIREMAMEIAMASKDGEVNFSPVLGEEIVFWRFLDGWDKVIRWRSECHLDISFTSDASSFQWATDDLSPLWNHFCW